MKKAICLALCFVFVFSAFSVDVLANTEPIIQGILPGQTVNGDTEISWNAVAGADYYTVAVRYIQDSDSGPLAYNSVKTESTSFILEKSVFDTYGKGAYRICVAAVCGKSTYYSTVITFNYSDRITDLTDKKIVCFGDSLTANGVWESILANRFSTDVINAGVGGTTTESSKQRFVTDVLAQSPDITFICFAYNDAVKMDGNNRADKSRVSLEQYEANLTYYVTELKKIGSDVILFSPNPVIEEYFNARPMHPGEDYVEDGGINALISKYTDIMAKVAEENGVYYFNLNAEFEGEDLYALINTDGTHPNNSGYALYARALGDFLEHTYSKPVFKKGDINDDGKIDSFDYLLCRSIVLGLYTPTELQTQASDATGDGKTDSFDYILIRSHVLGLYKITE